MIGRTLLKVLMLIFSLLPLSVVCRTGDLIGSTMHCLLKKRRKIGLSNLRMAFPEKSDRERVEIFITSWRNICKGVLEVMKYNHPDAHCRWLSETGNHASSQSVQKTPR